MLIAIPAENDPAEGRVAATPETVKKFVGLGAEVKVQTGAGLKSGIPDQEYALAGAAIAPDALATVKDADIVLRVRRPERGGHRRRQARRRRHRDHGSLRAYRCAELLGGGGRLRLRDGIDAAHHQGADDGRPVEPGQYRRLSRRHRCRRRIWPGHSDDDDGGGHDTPAKIFIMGVGVAGLQAIATARKLGAIVTATDVRPATKEQVVSLGAKFIAVEDEEFKQAETAAGYAKEMSADYKAKQAALTASHIAAQDIVITTALIPGRPAPVLVTAADGRIDASRLGYRRSCRRTWRKLRIGETRRNRRFKKWRQDRWPIEYRRALARHGLGALREKPSGFHRNA